MLGDINYPTYPSVSEGRVCLGKNEEEDIFYGKNWNPVLKKAADYLSLSLPVLGTVLLVTAA